MIGDNSCNKRPNARKSRNGKYYKWHVELSQAKGICITDTVCVPLTMTGSLFRGEEVIKEKTLPPDDSKEKNNSGYLLFSGYM